MTRPNRPLDRYRAVSERSIFQEKRASRIPVEEKPKVVEERWVDVERETARWLLTGVVRQEDGSWVALVEDRVTGTSQFIPVGKEVGGSTVVAIRPEAVTVRGTEGTDREITVGGVFQVLTATEKVKESGSGTSTPRETSAAPVAADPPPSNISSDRRDEILKRMRERREREQK